LLELPIWAANGGFCYACTRLYILQLVDEQIAQGAIAPAERSETAVRELTGAVPALNLITQPFIPRWLTDFDGDGNLEVMVLDGRYEHGFGLSLAASPEITRIYDWDGTRYADVSQGYPGYLKDQGDRAKSEVEITFGQALPSQATIGQAIRLLMAYELAGQRDEGWSLFWQLSDPVNWSGEAEPGLLDWLTRIRDYLKGQYDRGQPFAAWPPTTPGVFQPSSTGAQPPPVDIPPAEVTPTETIPSEAPLETPTPEGAAPVSSTATPGV
jgi:hypothetical protein